MKKYQKGLNSQKKGKNSIFGVFGKLNAKRAYIALSALVLILLFSFTAQRISTTKKDLKSSFDNDAWNNAISRAELEDDIGENSEKNLRKSESDSLQSAANAAAQMPKTKALTENESEFKEEVAQTFAETVQTAADAPQSFQKPSKGKVTNAFSGDELVFSKTMNDWRTHNGTDYAAEIGDQVLCAADGTVKSVCQDDLLGVVVTVDHGNGIETVYSNLQSLDFIKEGKQVKKGDIIGGVGECGGLEQSDGTHLHFEIKKDGIYENPEDYFLNQTN